MQARGLTQARPWRLGRMNMLLSAGCGTAGGLRRLATTPLDRRACVLWHASSPSVIPWIADLAAEATVADSRRPHALWLAGPGPLGSGTAALVEDHLLARLPLGRASSVRATSLPAAYRSWLQALGAESVRDVRPRPLASEEDDEDGLSEWMEGSWSATESSRFRRELHAVIDQLPLSERLRPPSRPSKFADELARAFRNWRADGFSPADLAASSQRPEVEELANAFAAWESLRRARGVTHWTDDAEVLVRHLQQQAKGADVALSLGVDTLVVFDAHLLAPADRAVLEALALTGAAQGPRLWLLADPLAASTPGRTSARVGEAIDGLRRLVTRVNQMTPRDERPATFQAVPLPPRASGVDLGADFDVRVTDEALASLVPGPSSDLARRILRERLRLRTGVALDDGNGEPAGAAHLLAADAPAEDASSVATTGMASWPAPPSLRLRTRAGRGHATRTFRGGVEGRVLLVEHPGPEDAIHSILREVEAIVENALRGSVSDLAAPVVLVDCSNAPDLTSSLLARLERLPAVESGAVAVVDGSRRWLADSEIVQLLLSLLRTVLVPDVEADASLVRLAASPLFGVQAATLAALMRDSVSRSQSARNRLLDTPLGLGAGSGETVPLQSVSTDPLQRRALQSLVLELRTASAAAASGASASAIVRAFLGRVGLLGALDAPESLRDEEDAAAIRCFVRELELFEADFASSAARARQLSASPTLAFLSSLEMLVSETPFEAREQSLMAVLGPGRPHASLPLVVLTQGQTGPLPCDYLVLPGWSATREPGSFRSSLATLPFEAPSGSRSSASSGFPASAAGPGPSAPLPLFPTSRDERMRIRRRVLNTRLAAVRAGVVFLCPQFGRSGARARVAPAVLDLLGVSSVAELTALEEAVQWEEVPRTPPLASLATSVRNDFLSRTTGPAETDALELPSKLSFSRVFEYEWCPQRFFLSRVVGVPSRTDPVMLYGSALHAGIEASALAVIAAVRAWELDGFRGAASDHGPTEGALLDAMLRAFNAAWTGSASAERWIANGVGGERVPASALAMPDRQACDLVQSARTALRNFAHREWTALAALRSGDASSRDMFVPVSSELAFEVPLAAAHPAGSAEQSDTSDHHRPPLALHGVIDRTEVPLQHLLECGTQRVLQERPHTAILREFKSSQQWKAETALAQQARDSRQLPVYALAHRTMFGAAPSHVVLEAIESGARVVRAVTPETLSDVEAHLQATAQSIAAGSFDPMPSVAKCKACPMRSACRFSLAPFG